MKTKIKRHYRSVVSVLLSVCMLVSCMTVGLIATDAARVSDEESVGYNVTGPVIINGHLNNNSWTSATMYQKDGNYYYSVDSMREGKEWKFSNNGTEYGSTSDSESTRKIYNYGESNGMTVQSGRRSTFRNQTGNYSGGLTIWVNGTLTKTWITNGKTATPIDVTVSSVDNAVVSATQGSVTVNEGVTDKQFQKGSDATVTITPDAGYVPGTLTVGSNTYTLSDLTKSGSNYTYTFTVPETATGTFTISAVMKRQIANSASISADPATLSAEGASAKVTVMPTTPATNNLKYTLYDDADNSVVDTVTVTNGSAAEFTVTPTAKYTYYYAVLEENPDSSTFASLTTDNVLVTNNALREKYTVTFAANDPSKGTVTAVTDGGVTLTSGDKVFADTVVTFTANPKTKCLFKKWGDNSTTTPRDVTITGDTTVTGNFAYDGYELLYNDTTITMKELDDGTYVSTSKVGYFTGSNLDTSKRFTIKRLSDDKVAVSNTNDSTYWISALNDKASLQGDNWVTSNNAAKDITKTWVNHSGQGAYVGFDPYTEKVWLSDNPQLARDVKIIAKNGTIRYDYDDQSHTNKIADGNPTRKFGTTTITKKSGTVAGSVTDAYSNNAKELSITGPENGNGVTLTITTSIVKSGYYVKGWVVNGETYLCKDSSGNPITGTTSDGNYSFDYVVDKFPDTVNGRIEITPVYYSTRANYVGFYVTGYEMAKSDWGNTLAIYSYKGSAPLDGDWPGQPMLKINGRYYAQIAADATGITLSNYVFDYVHNRTDKTMNLADNSTDKDKTIHQYQTYDFNDFKRIQTYKLDGQSNPEIVFSFKYKKGVWWNATNNTNDNFYKFSGMVNYNPDPAYPDNARIKDFAGPWEDLTNYYGKKVDIFETELTDAQLSNSTYYVVSNGYIWNEVGQYATDWIIYENNSGSLVKKYRFCPESVRLKATFNDSGQVTGDFESLRYLQGHPIKITYEFSNLSGYHDGARSSNYVDPNSSSNAYHGQPSYRGDGRWTYTQQTQVKAHVIIEYADNARSTFTRDYFQQNNYDYTSGTYYNPEPHTGLTTGTQAYFTDTSGPEKQTESEKRTKSNQYFNFKAEPDPDHEYTFIGWYLLDDGTYSLLDYNEDGTCSVKVDNNDVLVARFIKTPAGNVKLSHELMENSKNPDLGVTFNSAEIVDSSNNTVTTITGNPIATDNEGTTLIKSKYIKADYAAAGYKLKITLKTTPETSPSAEFKSFYYDINKSDTQTKITGTGSLGGTAVNVDNINTSSTDKAATIYVPLSYFFDVQDGEYFFDISKDTLKFYSELEVPKRTVTIKKVLPDFVSDSSTGFSVHIKVSDTENGTYSDITGTFTSSIPANSGSFTDGKVAIHNGETITFAVDKNKYFKVTEENIPSPYEFDALYFTNDTSNNLGNGYKCLADSDKSFEVRNKVFANYTINYTYPSRFNNLTGETLYGDQTYTVNGKIDSTDTNFDNYIDYTNSKVKKALVIAKNPFESDFMYNFVWDFNKTVYNPNGAAYTANVTTTTPTTQNVHVTFEFPYDYTDATGTDWTGTAKVYSATSDDPVKTAYQSPAAISIGYQTVPYALEPYTYRDENNVEQTSSRIHCTTAPKKCGGKDFLYWSIREKAIGSDEWVEVAKCYTNEYTYATFNDYHVRPIFVGDQEADTTTEENKSEATIKFLDTSRNQWNNNQKGTKSTSYAGQDMVYADFDVAYRYKGQDVDDSTDLNVGVLIENIGMIDTEYLLDHRNTTTADGKTAYTNSLAHYKDKTYYAYDAEAIKTYLRSVIHNDTPAADAQTAYQSTLGRAYTLNLKQRQPDQTLTNMNRVEYYHGSTVRSIANNADDKVNEWTVNNANTSGVFRAYSYIVDADGNVTLSEPTYYTLYGTATLDHLTTE